MKVTSLFSGAGGLDLGLHLVSCDGASEDIDVSGKTFLGNRRHCKLAGPPLAPAWHVGFCRHAPPFPTCCRPGMNCYCFATRMRGPVRSVGAWVATWTELPPPPRAPAIARLQLQSQGHLNTSVWFDPALQVLRAAFPGVRIHDDVTSLERLPEVQAGVTGGCAAARVHLLCAARCLYWGPRGPPPPNPLCTMLALPWVCSCLHKCQPYEPWVTAVSSKPTSLHPLPLACRRQSCWRRDSPAWTSAVQGCDAGWRGSPLGWSATSSACCRRALGLPAKRACAETSGQGW